MAQRFDLLALWVLVDGTAFGRGNLRHLGLAHQYLSWAGIAPCTRAPARRVLHTCSTTTACKRSPT